MDRSTDERRKNTASERSQRQHDGCDRSVSRSGIKRTRTPRQLLKYSTSVGASINGPDSERARARDTPAFACQSNSVAGGHVTQRTRTSAGDDQ